MRFPFTIAKELQADTQPSNCGAYLDSFYLKGAAPEYLDKPFSQFHLRRSGYSFMHAQTKQIQTKAMW